MSKKVIVTPELLKQIKRWSKYSNSFLKQMRRDPKCTANERKAITGIIELRHNDK